ncbi:MAG: NADH-quinone oxidoreductase subunit C [Dokdonella sp.]|jgi:NADH-quinone oxidoreductase subunit C|uniref:NADH-quinone oxidoreductase subunit C n=2 Tax=Dokdonella sp. TaxID=2291710 RepID=UPI0025C0B292|nr:NADH-quinone oxidoreductase subunit C [Dokdonella sp.]MBK8122691.1 NADH-quinone oxidoreductase subunit C [Dokdonella sp.]HNV08316.1 NADH-quinone oxidoreductase subunit C [Dokdonella sp.]HPW05052.1 NADH-quinone oxidoreductase subunit C [Dokdonella sp.]HQV50491.1 NADH-quinone oxidoreductase subunit C [Dokdonella sp.]
MNDSPVLARKLEARLGAKVVDCTEALGETTIEVLPENWLAVARFLRDEAEFAFDQCMDVCGVDYLSYGSVEWDTTDVSSQGFSRGVEGKGAGRFNWSERPHPGHVAKRFAVVAHLMSLEHNQRVRLRAFCADDDLPSMPSLVDVWTGVNWFEREAFDLYGILFEGHPDLRRILTDYGFVGHAFRKDFPLIGNVEVRYDPEKRRVVYEPVSIEPRVLVPRTIRDDSRYEQARAEREAGTK